MRNNKNYKRTRRGSSPTGGKRACLCWDSNTYHVDCCDGSLHAQGIGNITRVSTPDEDYLLQENSDLLLQENNFKIIL